MDNNIRVLINGFGRIGRAFFRIATNDALVDVVGINDKYLSKEEILYLAKFDSVYKTFSNEITPTDNGIEIGGKHISIYQSDNLNDLSLSNTDVVVFCSGDYKNINNQIAKLELSGVAGVFTSFLNHHLIQDFVFGFHETRDIKKTNLISTNICDVVAILPVYNYFRNSFHLQSASIVTLHPYLPYQKILDGKSEKLNFALGRSAINNLIPKATSLEDNLKSYFPQDRILCMSFRVPTNTVACAILTLWIEEEIDQEQLQKELAIKCQKDWSNIALYSKDNCVSGDYSGTPYAFIIDHQWIDVIGHQIRVCIWYDNEWGYATKILELIKHKFVGG